MSDNEDRAQPAWGKMIGGSAVGAILGMGAIGGLAGQLGLPGALFIGLGALFGAGIGLSLVVVLSQAMSNSEL